ncbi:hypothetical protein [Rhodopseudomonas palustris]|uniref:hypothetical protein n=1 Tax=Rhodopseudomonas palustris TaxID=1076 RepID=UPI000D1A2139|nr:hypothetical protein [Rhodopseudomonas palustris]
MNTKINSFAAVLLAALLIAPVAVTAASCGDLDSNGHVISCGNGSPELVVNGYGLTNSQSTHVAAGASVADAAGISFACPAWYGPTLYCVDVTSTDYYKNGARAIAKFLQANGLTLGAYAYWLTN